MPAKKRIEYVVYDMYGILETFSTKSVAIRYARYWIKKGDCLWIDQVIKKHIWGKLPNGD